MTNEEFIASISLENEEWKEVPDYEGLYMVSTSGRVVSLDRITCTKDGNQRHNKPSLLNPQKEGKAGYYRVNLRKNGKTKTCNIHRLVAMTFIPNPLNKPEVDHIDTDKTNNNVKNLRWCSAVENMRNPLTMKRMRITVYDNITKHKRFTRPVASIKNGNIVKMYPSLRSVLQDGYDPDCVWNCCNGKSKIHGELQWMYLTSEKLLSSVNQRTLARRFGTLYHGARH